MVQHSVLFLTENSKDAADFQGSSSYVTHDDKIIVSVAKRRIEKKIRNDKTISFTYSKGKNHINAYIVINTSVVTVFTNSENERMISTEIIEERDKENNGHV